MSSLEWVVGVKQKVYKGKENKNYFSHCLGSDPTGSDPKGLAFRESPLGSDPNAVTLFNLGGDPKGNLLKDMIFKEWAWGSDPIGVILLPSSNLGGDPKGSDPIGITLLPSSNLGVTQID